MNEHDYPICPRCMHKLYNIGIDEDLNIIYQCANCGNIEIEIINEYESNED